MAELGMSPLKAWEATSRQAARLLDIDTDYGTLEEGKVGDVVVLDGAHDDLTGLRDRIRSVHMAGEQVFARTT